MASDPQGRVGGTAGMKRTPLLVAPGIEILTTAPRQAYDFLSGSSLAAAHVSGIAALLLEVEPRLSPAQVYALLRASTPPIEVASGTPQAAIGLVDACTAVARLLGQPACP